MQTIRQRIEKLRSCLRSEGLSAFIIPSTDPHSGEYIPAYWQAREWISGFNGSAGTVVVTTDRAALWTDSRYFLQAADQLKDTGIELMKERMPETPSIPAWLEECLSPGETVGIDGWVNSIAEIESMQNELAKNGILLRTDYNPIDFIWKERPALPTDSIFIHPLQYAGVSCEQKIKLIRKELLQFGAEGILISALDEIAWTLNLRGSDVHCNPVFVAYLLITENENILFINPDKLTDEVRQYLAKQHVETEHYNQVDTFLRDYPYSTLYIDNTHTNFAIAQAVPTSTRLVRGASPIAMLKAQKNATEIEGFRQAMLRDGVALVKFFKWLEEAVPRGKESELSIDRKLYSLRAEQALFKGISFDTIAGYKEHGAIVHYEASAKTDKPLSPEGLLLIDSGAQYSDGTTDITRTIALGPVNADEKRDYTLVLKGHIGLSRACFPKGTCGTQLDVLARAAMWCDGTNFLHGTGHGVGSFLNVHEGPHQIRMNHVPAPLCSGMTVTNEPGIYRAGRYGIRTENILLVVPFKETECGEFYHFETLTLCPIDTQPLEVSMLNNEEKNWLNNYHHMVYEKLSPMLDDEHRLWLQKKTEPII